MGSSSRKKIIGLAGLLVLAGCSRSNAYRQDQNPASSGNAAAERGYSTSRIESMGQPRKRVIVFDFWNDTPNKANELGEFGADELRRYLHQTQRVIVPTDIKAKLATEEFIQGDKVRVSQLIREGRKLGVAVMVIGRMSRSIFRQRGDEVGLLRQKQSLAGVDIELKIFDVAGGREIMAIAKSGDSSTNTLVALDPNNTSGPEFRTEMLKMAVRNAVEQTVPEILKSVEKLGWEGRIAKISSGKVFVNAGKASGLVPGDILRVLTQGDDIYDPVTGAYLGRSAGQVKGTLEVLDFIGPDGAVSEIHTGSNFQEGDAIRLY